MKYIRLNQNDDCCIDCTIGKDDLSLMLEALTNCIGTERQIFKVKQFLILYDELADIKSRYKEEYLQKHEDPS